MRGGCVVGFPQYVFCKAYEKLIAIWRSAQSMDVVEIKARKKFLEAPRLSGPEISVHGADQR